MSVNKFICPRCQGKGKAKLKDTEMIVNCPTCGGLGYLKNDFTDDNNNNEQQIEQNNNIKPVLNQNIEMPEDKQILILQQIIKNPDLFLAGINLYFKDENSELFIYLQNQHIFEIINQEESMLIKLRPEFKNSLAKQCIEYLMKHTKKSVRKNIS